MYKEKVLLYIYYRCWSYKKSKNLANQSQKRILTPIILRVSNGIWCFKTNNYLGILLTSEGSTLQICYKIHIRKYFFTSNPVPQERNFTMMLKISQEPTSCNRFLYYIFINNKKLAVMSFDAAFPVYENFTMFVSDSWSKPANASLVGLTYKTIEVSKQKNMNVQVLVERRRMQGNCSKSVLQMSSTKFRKTRYEQLSLVLSYLLRRCWLHYCFHASVIINRHRMKDKCAKTMVLKDPVKEEEEKHHTHLQSQHLPISVYEDLQTAILSSKATPKTTLTPTTQHRRYYVDMVTDQTNCGRASRSFVGWIVFLIKTAVVRHLTWQSS